MTQPLNTGYEFPKQLTSKEVIEHVKRTALEAGWGDIAAAADNLLDLLEQKKAELDRAAKLAALGITEGMLTLKPYNALGTRGQVSWDDHEVHAYTVDGS